MSILRYVAFGLSLVLVETLNSLYKISVQIKDGDRQGEMGLNTRLVSNEDLRWRKARGERNLYMAGFCLILLGVIGRLVNLVSNEIVLKDKIKELTGQKTLKTFSFEKEKSRDSHPHST